MPRLLLPLPLSSEPWLPPWAEPTVPGVPCDTMKTAPPTTSDSCSGPETPNRITVIGQIPSVSIPTTAVPANAMPLYPDEGGDQRLFQRTADGDSAAFTALYDRHSTMVFSIALRILEDREEASDVLQQVFLKFHQKAALYSPEKGRPAAWLAALARNQSVDQLRRIKSRRQLGERLCQETLPSLVPGPPDHGNAHFFDEVELLHSAMAALRPEEVHVLQLAYFGGLSQTEISQMLSQPLGSIKARIRRAVVKLRSALKGIVDPPPATARPLRSHTPVPG
jgi:RNA polymerase sigma-70 factor (ECF subfamily)